MLIVNRSKQRVKVNSDFTSCTLLHYVNYVTPHPHLPVENHHDLEGVPTQVGLRYDRPPSVSIVWFGEWFAGSSPSTRRALSCPGTLSQKKNSPRPGPDQVKWFFRYDSVIKQFRKLKNKDNVFVCL